MSLEALKHLGLDQVWWLVSPGNPLKNPEVIAPLEDRLQSIEALLTGTNIIATDIEAKIGTTYTIDIDSSTSSLSST